MSTLDTMEAGDGLRERKKQHTRRAIHEAAYRLVDEHGLEGTTIDLICQEAEVSSRTFFNYYPSKMAAALGIPEDPVDADAAARFRAATGSLVDALCDMVVGGGQFAARQARLKGLVTRHPELLRTLSGMMTATRGRFIELATERASSPAEAELAVTLVLAAVTMTVHTGGEDQVPTAALLRTTVDSLARVRTAPLVGDHG